MTAREQLASDLRDVIVGPDGDVFVSRFKRAELLRLPGGRAPEMTAMRPRAQPVQFPEPHTGCAATLHDRFDPQCGGDKHGKTAQLAPSRSTTWSRTWNRISTPEPARGREN